MCEKNDQYINAFFPEEAIFMAITPDNTPFKMIIREGTFCKIKEVESIGITKASLKKEM